MTDDQAGGTIPEEAGLPEGSYQATPRPGLRNLEEVTQLLDNLASSHDWRTDIAMADDETQTLADVLGVMRSNDLHRQVAFVEWLASEWYDAKAELQSLRAEQERGEMPTEREWLEGAPVVFGLRAQGHLPTIKRMLGEGRNWEAIGREIGWDPDTAKRFFYVVEAESND